MALQGACRRAGAIAQAPPGQCRPRPVGPTQSEHGHPGSQIDQPAVDTAASASVETSSARNLLPSLAMLLAQLADMSSDLDGMARQDAQAPWMLLLRPSFPRNPLM